MGIILRTTELTKSFKGQIAVNRISLSIEKNSVYGLLGPNGAGKTTIMKMITGILKPTSGGIEFDGHDWSRNDLKEIGALIDMLPIWYTRRQKSDTITETWILARKLPVSFRDNIRVSVIVYE